MRNRTITASPRHSSTRNNNAVDCVSPAGETPLTVITTASNTAVSAIEPNTLPANGENDSPAGRGTSSRTNEWKPPWIGETKMFDSPRKRRQSAMSYCRDGVLASRNVDWREISAIGNACDSRDFKKEKR